MVTTLDYSGHMIFVYDNGKIAKVPLSGYTGRRKKMMKAYSDKTHLTGLCFQAADGDLYLTRGSDKAMVMNTSLLSPITSRVTAGVQVFTLRKNTKLTTMQQLTEADEEMEYYRVDKVPSAGHFIRNQMRLD